MESPQNLKINVDEVLRARMPRLRRWMPRWLVGWLERLICQDKMNEMLRVAGDSRGADFCSKVLDHLDVKTDFKGVEHMPDVNDRRVLIVCNHPLGGLDGIALIDFVTRYYGVEPYFIVNDLLMAIEPLRDIFVPINKHGAQSRSAVAAVEQAFASDRPLIIFPAGLCSRRGKGGVVADLQWQKSFVARAESAGRTIIPIYFDGENSSFFYKFAKFRTRLGIKLNIEMVRLPREVFRARGSRFAVYVGESIAPSAITREGETRQQTADRLRLLVYSLRDNAIRNGREDN